jgi:alpha-1,3-glucosyltransferase
MGESRNAFLFTTICVAVFLRAAISLNSHSGEAKPPMFGDYEAQRHWQEVTANLPISDWYEQTDENDLQYWGLDYPPLTAYHSYTMGKVAQHLNGQFVELHVSRGISTDEHKLFMRWTVLVADLLIYIPAVILACLAVYEQLKSPTTSVGLLHGHILLFLVYPGQILIDNAHFQYNNVSLGLALLAIAQILCGHDLFGAFFFALSLNYKQMELYHALPFFFYLLARCFQGRAFGAGVWKLAKLGATVVTTFAVLWSPWLGSPSSALQVLHRLFPVARGVFEDKVSNVWCIVNVFYKLK